MSEGPQQQNLQECFETFFEAWISRQQSFHEKLLSLSIQSDYSTTIEQQQFLIEEVLSHYQRYFKEKSRLANADVLLLFSPTWLSSWERALLWPADYKPSLLHQIVDGAAQGLTEEQKQRLEKLKSQTRREERQLTGTMANVQETVAGRSVMYMTPRVERLLDGEITSQDSAMEALKRANVGVLERADKLRVSIVRNRVGILSPPQMVQFLAAAAQFQLRVRRWGLQSDAQRQRVCSLE